MGSSLMASPSRGHEKRGTQSECLPVSTAGNLARSKSGTWVDCSKPCLQKVWKAQRLTKKWKECTVIKEHRWGETTCRASLRDQTYDFPENRKAIEWIAADTERALWCHEMSTQHSLFFCGFFVSVGETVMRRKHRFFREERYIWWIGNTIYTS